MLPNINLFGDWLFVERLRPRSSAFTELLDRNKRSKSILNSESAINSPESEKIVSKKTFPQLNFLRKKPLSVGDIVVCISPISPTKFVCKRVIGLPGDKVLINPPLYPDEDQHRKEYLIVPEGYVWIQGDNLPFSIDSRDYGPIPVGLIRGRVRARLFPDARWF
ncbi:hypothetical protein HK098_001076 [Nowakowskiella sp. JEL0407]|nr:hypothetical protein HK098_001076 [Nowakowskiella sp. JEL0407]